MGDRTSVWIRIGGQVKDLDDLVDALEAEGMGSSYAPLNRDEIIAHMKASAGDPDGAEFTADEVNYGNCDDLEEACRKQGLAYEFHWHAGGGFGDGGHIFSTTTGRWSEYSGEAGNTATTAHEIRSLKVKTLEELLAHLDSIDRFQPGPLVLPPPLIQAVLKARKEHPDGQS